MTLSRDELEDMEAKLRAAFASSMDCFTSVRYHGDTSEVKQRAIMALATTATALLQVDERQRQLDAASNVVRLSGRMPGKE